MIRRFIAPRLKQRLVHRVARSLSCSLISNRTAPLDSPLKSMGHSGCRACSDFWRDISRFLSDRHRLPQFRAWRTIPSVGGGLVAVCQLEINSVAPVFNSFARLKFDSELLQRKSNRCSLVPPQPIRTRLQQTQTPLCPNVNWLPMPGRCSSRRQLPALPDRYSSVLTSYLLETQRADPSPQASLVSWHFRSCC